MEKYTIVVTDLTRFKNEGLLCMAGLTLDGLTCIRPMRSTLPSYLSYQECKEKTLLPGYVLEGEFSTPQVIDNTHPEDRHFSSMSIVRQCTSAEFQDVLELSSFNTFEAGFGIAPVDKRIVGIPIRSIFTLKILPSNFKIVVDKYDSNKIKGHVTDNDENTISFLSITDLGFYDFVGNASTRKVSVDEINSFIRTQDTLYLRMGLSRAFKSPDGRSGLWIQINGIYTFPNFEHVLRGY